MSTNLSPIWALTPNLGAPNVVLTTGANNYDGTSGSAVLVFTAGANGSFLNSINANAIGTNVQTVLRVFFNNGSAVGTAGNNIFAGEMTLIATTGSATNVNPKFSIAFNIALPAGWRVYVLLATTVAAGWAIAGVGGDY